jgi:hypothetical protein
MIGHQRSARKELWMANLPFLGFFGVAFPQALLDDPVLE